MPIQILMKIFETLPPKDIFSLLFTCKYFKDFVETNLPQTKKQFGIELLISFLQSVSEEQI
jgi:hypothetical protein